MLKLRSWMVHAFTVSVWPWQRCNRASLSSRGGAPSVTTRAGFSATSREPSASALGDLRVTVRASPPGQFPLTSHSSRSSCSVRLPGDSAVPSYSVPSVSFGAPIEDQMSIAAAVDWAIILWGWRFGGAALIVWCRHRRIGLLELPWASAGPP